MIIGLTIAGFGASAPESPIAAAANASPGLAVGNAPGSDMFNTLAVMGIPGLIYPSAMQTGVLERDIPVVFILTIVLAIMVYGFKGPGRINRLEGAVLLGCFVGYQILLYFTELR